MRVEDRLLGSLGLFFPNSVGPAGARLNLLGTLAEYAASAVDRQAKSRELELSRQRLFQSQEMVRRQVSGELHGPVQTRLLVVWHRLGQLKTQIQTQGISPEHLERIFDPFFTTKGPNKGSGLGLMIVHQIVSEHGGSIQLSSELGGGTTFQVRLPLAGDAE